MTFIVRLRVIEMYHLRVIAVMPFLRHASLDSDSVMPTSSVAILAQVFSFDPVGPLCTCSKCWSLVHVAIQMFVLTVEQMLLICLQNLCFVKNVENRSGDWYASGAARAIAGTVAKLRNVLA